MIFRMIGLHLAKVSRETLVVHEILRAAAWGDEATLKELIPLSGRLLGRGSMGPTNGVQFYQFIN